jgi:hypothetical protein
MLSDYMLGRRVRPLEICKTLMLLSTNRPGKSIATGLIVCDRTALFVRRFDEA